MSRYPLPLTRIVHENLSVLMNFAFSRGPLERLIETKFVGEWKYLRKGLLEVSEDRALKACFELALFLRMLDDEEGMSDYLREIDSNLRFGVLHRDGKSDKPLGLRDVANKILHSSELQWDFSSEERPSIVCTSRERDKWTSAEIDVVSLAGFCGELMH